MRAGDLVLGGEIPRAIYAYERAGRGQAGWQAAEAVIRERARFAATPVAEQAIQAVLGHTRDVVEYGRRYQAAGPDYTPRLNAIPDLRRLEERAVIPPAVGPSGRRESVFWNHGVVEIRDQQGRLFNLFSVTVPSDSLLSKAEMEAALNAQGRPFFDTFVRSEQADRPGGGYQFSYSLRIEGVYRGY